MAQTGHQRTILNPVVPYVGTIFGGLEPGQMVVVHGTVHSDADRFQIDFQCGSSIHPRSDVAFHFNPRFKGSGHIVCNTLQNEKWGWEEKTYHLPFTKGQPFEVIFLVFHHKFQVSSNGKNLLVYKHRIGLEKVDTLGISGKVKINSIGFLSQPTILGSQPTSFAVNSIEGNQGRSEKLLTFSVPYTGCLPSALIPGKTVVIKGEVHKYAKRFAIDLKPHGSKDIALHLNPRIKEKVFVRNTYLCESWGEEERHLLDFPFCPEMYFEILIFCELQQFKVAVNGVHQLEYKHRFKDLNKINEVSVNGDVELHDVRIW
ncbi:galectin-8 [Xenopus tropicalis]|uniref:Galectin n=1 Tax=Xenopus tropicalis TaxID=8364 RepID=B4F6X4_XENTR|nr:galectin-8 [Xenopus tropicalis]AAI68047.1 Unknown (protein for MGC:185482) [Xenopus tropicalis]|eukprot:NP_001135558.1 galectin-8 [Xenopus tropicalis]